MNRGRGLSVIDGGRDAPLRSQPSIWFSVISVAVVIACMVFVILYW